MVARMKIDLSTNAVGTILDLMDRAGMDLNAMTLAHVLDCSLTKAHAIARNASMIRRGCSHDFIVDDCGRIDGRDWGPNRDRRPKEVRIESKVAGNC